MLIFVVMGFIAAIGVLATLALGNMIVFGIALVLFLIFIVVIAVVAAAMQGIFVTALYSYARTGVIPSAFSRDLIQHAFVPKQDGREISERVHTRSFFIALRTPFFVTSVTLLSSHCFTTHYLLEIHRMMEQRHHALLGRT